MNGTNSCVSACSFSTNLGAATDPLADLPAPPIPRLHASCRSGCVLITLRHTHIPEVKMQLPERLGERMVHYLSTNIGSLKVSQLIRRPYTRPMDLQLRELQISIPKGDAIALFSRLLAIVH